MNKIQHKNTIGGIEVDDAVTAFPIVLKINYISFAGKQLITRPPMRQFIRGKGFLSDYQTIFIFNRLLNAEMINRPTDNAFKCLFGLGR